jgi:hypothetical protein
MYKSIILLLFPCLLACSGNRTLSESTSQKSRHPSEKMKYEKLEKGFYRDSIGGLFIKTQSLLRPPEEYGPDFYRPVPAIDIPTYERLCTQGWYAKDKDSVYVVHGTTDGLHIWTLKDADAATFECMNYRWGKDKNYVFQNGVILNGMNPKNAIVIDADSNGFFNMLKDDDQLFYGSTEVFDVDVNSFYCIRTDTSLIYQDKNSIYEKNYFLTRDEKYKRRK